MSRFCSACGSSLGSGVKFCPACGASAGTAAAATPSQTPMTSPVSESLLRDARSLPLKQRPEAWWDAMSVLAGAFGGALWFIYSSIRGMPKPDFLRGPWLDFLPAGVMLVMLWIKRMALMERVFRFQQAFAVKDAAGKLKQALLLAGGAWLIMKLMRAQRFINIGEGLDLLTPVLMTLVPMVLVMFRKETDSLLAPIQPLRRRLGPAVAIGMSLTAPFATAYLLYHVFNLRMYPLMHANLPLGLLASYALAREPRLGGPPLLPGGGTGPALHPGVSLWLLFSLVASLLAALTGEAWADDFLRDPFNLNDGLRTDTFAPILSGVSTAVVSILVNGVEVTKTIIQDTKPVKEGEQPVQRKFQLHIRTVDAQGQPSTTVREGNNGVVYIYAWCMDENGPFPAGDASIRFPQSLGAEGLTLSDLGTQHQQRCACVSLPVPVPDRVAQSVTVTVNAGNGQWSIPVTLKVEVGLTLAVDMINARRSTAVKRDFPVFDAHLTEEGWTFTELVAYFHTAESNEPTAPGFQTTWQEPAASPAWLELSPLVSDDNQLTWRCQPKMKSDVQVPADWLASDGVITVSFKCKSAPADGSAGTDYLARVGVRLPPNVELACRFEADEQQGREVYGVEMETNQFLCDAVDELGVIFFPHDRMDKDDPESVAEYDLEKVEFELDERSRRQFSLVEDKEFEEEGQKRFVLKSKSVVLHEANLPEEVTIPTKAKARPRTGDKSKAIDLAGQLVIKPGYVFLKLWVVGGGARGTSEAACFACMAPDASKPLKGFPLMIKVDAVGSATLALESADRASTGDDGLASWALRYGGLTWDNYFSAGFNVRCGVPVGDAPPVRGVNVAIDIHDNVNKLIQTIYDSAATLKLNNDLFQSNCLDYAYPDDMSGPYTNMRSWISTEWDDYICGNYSARIFNWMAKRRFGDKSNEDPDQYVCMNGIEANEYAIWDLGPITHHFAGFHLSGSGPLDSPRFIDPWWCQNWRDPKLRTLDGLYTKNTERYLMVKSILFKAAIALLLVKVAVAAGAVAATTKLYAIIKAGSLGMGTLNTTVGDVHEYGPQASDFGADGKYTVYRANWATRAVVRLKSAKLPSTGPLKNW